MVEAKASAGSTHWTSDEMMTVAAARELANGLVCFVGIGLPSTAANLARATHAPDVVLIYESGCIGCKPERLPLSIGDGELSRSADVVVGIPELFTYWLQAGRIDMGFLGAAQIDRFGNINSTVIGDYRHPTVRLPGAGGAPEIASSCSKVIVTLRHSPRAMVEKMDFISSVGHGEGLHFRQKINRPGAGPQAIITDLGVLRYDAETAEFVLVSAHPGVEVSSIVSATGWPLRQAPHVEITRPPSEVELAALRNLTRVDGESI